MILIQFVFHAWQQKIKPAVYLRRAVQGSDGDGNADFGDGEDEAAMTMGTGLGRNTNARLYICPCQTQHLLKPLFDQKHLAILMGNSEQGRQKIIVVANRQLAVPTFRAVSNVVLVVF